MTVASTAGGSPAFVPELPDQAFEGLCLHPGQAVSVFGADRPGDGAAPPSSRLGRIGLEPLVMRSYAGLLGQLHALRRRDLIYFLPRFVTPWIHSYSLLISAAAFPFGEDSDADRPDVKAWTCSIR